MADFSMVSRPLSLPKSVAAMGLGPWNKQGELNSLLEILDRACQATTVEVAVKEVKGACLYGNMWAYVYLRALAAKNFNLYYATLLAEPALLLPIAYTPTVGEACQKYGLMPQFPRGCYVSITDRGNLKAVLKEYAEQMMPKDANGNFQCQCIVFSDGGRILGLGDLGTWGMGIPMGKLDLYTVCGGFDPNKTIPVMIDAGCSDSTGNSAGLTIRDHALYTGLKQDRVTHISEAGTKVNTAYYGKDSLIGEFLSAASELFGTGCVLQFEDFNSNDAFPLLAEYREKFLTYNDDIQGTASVTVAGIFGGIKIQKPLCKSLITEARSLKFLFHGAGSANIGTAMLLHMEAGVPLSQIVCTNSRGLIWVSEDGKEGNFRNNEQKGVAMIGKPDCGKDLVSVIHSVKPHVLIGAVGVDPGCFTEAVIKAMVDIQEPGWRPIVMALSNPKSQAEISAADCYKFSDGKAIYGSGTRFPPCQVQGKTREAGQVNNFFCFPGMSFGAMACKAKTLPERSFMVAAEAIANCLDENDIEKETVVPDPARIREVGKAVAHAVVMDCQESGLAQTRLGNSSEEVAAKLESLMWKPKEDAIVGKGVKRSMSNCGQSLSPRERLSPRGKQLMTVVSRV